jgi:Xaa-Pro aminopeptidase
MTDFLFHGDTERSAAMRHELPVSIGDPFLLGIVGGRMHVMASTLERTRMAAAAPNAVLHDVTDLGFYELLESGMSYHELDLELTSRAAAAMGVGEAVVDPEMSVAVADRLRSDGIVVHPDHQAIAARRRVKSGAELAGIRRAQAAAEAGMSAAAAVLRQAVPDGERLMLGGEALTAESVRAALRDACQLRGAPTPPDVIVASVWQGFGHEAGSGPLPANLPIVIDLWPRDERSGCCADMTRTFVVGEVADAVRAQEILVREAIERAREAVGPGVTGRELHALVCERVRVRRASHSKNRPGGGPERGLSVLAWPRRWPGAS